MLLSKFLLFIISGNAFEVPDTIAQIPGKYNVDAFRYILMRERYKIIIMLIYIFLKTK